MSDIQRAVDVIHARTPLQPDVGIVLGSGLGGLAAEVQDAVSIPYADIPGFPLSTVHGHSGELVLGTMEGKRVVMQRGRAHFYEGYTPQQVTFAIRLMHALGAGTVILTNAAGGVNAAFEVGDVMLIEDHINFVGMSGNNPLMGPNDDSVGPRFLGMSQTYDRTLREAAMQIATREGIPLHKGVYCCISGPTFETPAEIRMMRVIGADAVGMSTVHEVLTARHAGMRVAAFSGITNRCIDQVDTELDTNHEEVLEAGKVIVPRLQRLIRGVLRAV
jgi:purine-nucleoside phosphorylase